MKDTDLAWLAGFFEGEGCFFLGSGKQRPKAVRISASLVSVDRDVLEKAAALMGTVVQTPNRRTVTGKQVYTVWLSSTKAVDLMKQLLPHMGDRRSKKIREIIEAEKTRPGCPWGESNGHAKLTVEKVVQLRTMNPNPPRGTWAKLARQWNVSQASLYFAFHGKTWRKAA